MASRAPLPSTQRCHWAWRAQFGSQRSEQRSKQKRSQFLRMAWTAVLHKIQTALICPMSLFQLLCSSDYVWTRDCWTRSFCVLRHHRKFYFSSLQEIRLNNKTNKNMVNNSAVVQRRDFARQQDGFMPGGGYRYMSNLKHSRCLLICPLTHISPED